MIFICNSLRILKFASRGKTNTHVGKSISPGLAPAHFRALECGGGWVLLSLYSAPNRADIAHFFSNFSSIRKYFCCRTLHQNAMNLLHLHTTTHTHTYTYIHSQIAHELFMCPCVAGWLAGYVPSPPLLALNPAAVVTYGSCPDALHSVLEIINPIVGVRHSTEEYLLLSPGIGSRGSNGHNNNKHGKAITFMRKTFPLQHPILGCLIIL